MPDPKRPCLQRMYEDCGSSVLRRARAILGNDTDAQELLQDIFISLIQRPEQFSGRCSPMTFLYRMTTNRCLNIIRDRSNRQRLLANDVTDQAPISMPSPPSGSNPELICELHRALEQLPEDTARVAVYYYLDDLSQAEVAELMQCSRRQIRRHLTIIDNFAQDPSPNTTFAKLKFPSPC